MSETNKVTSRIVRREVKKEEKANERQMPVENSILDLRQAEQKQMMLSQMQCGVPNVPSNLVPVYPMHSAQILGQINQNIGGLQNQVGMGMEIISRQIANIGPEKKKRHRVVSHFIACDEEQKILMHKLFDDNTTQGIPLILNTRGPINIFVYKFAEFDFAIYNLVFGDMSMHVWGNMADLTVNGLYSRFICCGIAFTLHFSKRQISEALFNKFVPEIKNCDEIIEISGLAGWDENYFRTSRDFEYIKNIEKLPRLPVLKKRMMRNAQFDLVGRQYFELLKKIENVEDRIVIMLYPYAAVLCSIMARYRLRLPIALNFIILNTDFDAIVLLYFLQIFNRENFETYFLGESEKNIQVALSESKDETIVFSGFTDKDNSAYKNGKLLKNINNISGKVLGKYNLGDGMKKSPEIALSFITNQYVHNRNVRNICVDNDFGINWRDVKDIDTDVIGTVISSFVQYVQENIERTISIMKEKKSYKTKEEEFWRKLLVVVIDFWKSGGVSLEEEIKIDDGFNFLWSPVFHDTEDVVTIFIESVRSQMPKLTVLNKKAKTETTNIDVVFDKDYIWIPTEKFDTLLKRGGLQNKKHEILSRSKNTGILITDDCGFSRKLMIGGKRSESYQFLRKSFNQLGRVEIIELAESEVEK